MNRFALSAVSPAVVVPGILSLSRKGYGVAKGIPTLLIAASSIDDVLAITLYTIFLSLTTSGTHSNLVVCKNPYVEENPERKVIERSGVSEMQAECLRSTILLISSTL